MTENVKVMHYSGRRIFGHVPASGISGGDGVEFQKSQIGNQHHEPDKDDRFSRRPVPISAASAAGAAGRPKDSEKPTDFMAIAVDYGLKRQTGAAP
jgi:hypothetical protein